MLIVYNSKEYRQIIDAENATIPDFATLATGEDFDISPTSVKIVSEGDAIFQFEYRTVGFPNGNIDRVAGVEHRASGRYVYRVSHEIKCNDNRMEM